MDQRAMAIASALGGLSSCGAKWCLCFGALLSMIRDRRLVSDGDVDVGIIGSHHTTFDYLRNSLPMGHCVVGDNGIPINASFAIGDVILDVYWWYRKDGHAYHCFDENQEHPPTGRLREYHWKGIPDRVFWPRAEDVKGIPNTCYNRRMVNGTDPSVVPFGLNEADDWTYNMPVPGLESEGAMVRIPYGFGLALDCWYPGQWMVKDSQYGVSKCANEFTVKSCAGVFR